MDDGHPQGDEVFWRISGRKGAGSVNGDASKERIPPIFVPRRLKTSIPDRFPVGIIQDPGSFLPSETGIWRAARPAAQRTSVCFRQAMAELSLQKKHDRRSRRFLFWQPYRDESLFDHRSIDGIRICLRRHLSRTCTGKSRLLEILPETERGERATATHRWNRCPLGRRQGKSEPGRERSTAEQGESDVPEMDARDPRSI